MQWWIWRIIFFIIKIEAELLTSVFNANQRLMKFALWFYRMRLLLVPKSKTASRLSRTWLWYVVLIKVWHLRFLRLLFLNCHSFFTSCGKRRSRLLIWRTGLTTSACFLAFWLTCGGLLGISSWLQSLYTCYSRLILAKCAVGMNTRLVRRLKRLINGRLYQTHSKLHGLRKMSLAFYKKRLINANTYNFYSLTQLICHDLQRS
jgi:hypothetical protein